MEGYLLKATKNMLLVPFSMSTIALCNGIFDDGPLLLLNHVEALEATLKEVHGEMADDVQYFAGSPNWHVELKKIFRE